MWSPFFDVEVYHVTPVTDRAGGSQLQVAGPLGTLRAILSRGKGTLLRLGVGEEAQYDVAILVRNLPTNQWFLAYQEAEPWLYAVVTDQKSGWYGSVFRVETVLPGHAQKSEYLFHVVLACTELKDADKVEYENGRLRAKQ